LLNDRFRFSVIKPNDYRSVAVVVIQVILKARVNTLHRFDWSIKELPFIDFFLDFDTSHPIDAESSMDQSKILEEGAPKTDVLVPL